MRLKRHFAAVLALVAAGMLTACDDPDPIVGPDLLTDEVEATLDEVLQDAYRAYYTYTVANADFGSAGPFASTAAEEMAYVESLRALYADHDAVPPASLWNASNVPRFLDLGQACLIAEEGEVATFLMLERHLGMALPGDVRNAYEGMRNTTRTQHRAGFRSCAGGAIPPVDPTVEEAMTEALQDEYRMFYTYGRVLADLGDLIPFSNIRDAEWQHVGAVGNLFVKRELDVPASTWTLANVPGYASLAAACAAAAEMEVENALMYDRLLLETLPADVERVFENLREASLEHHLPAFQQCATGITPPASNEVQAAMAEALQAEYQAYFTYSGVVEDFEPDFPFSVIRDAEESHYTAILNLYDRRGLQAPQSQWDLGNVPRYATLAAACDAALAEEFEMIAMYDRLLGLALPEDVARVFGNLLRASEERHVPAFQRC